MACSDIYNGPTESIKPRRMTPEEANERLNALPPSLRKHFLESMQYNKEILEELAKM